MSGPASRIAENVGRIRAQIAHAASRSGRSPDAVTLVAVTKYVGIQEIEALLAAGCTDLGESRPQSLWEKAAQTANNNIRWHLIGHLQRNKIRRTLPLVSLIHSVDSSRLLAALSDESQSLGEPTAGLLEINVSGDATKHGLSTDEAERLIPTLDQFPHVQIHGLMTMAAREGDSNTARRNFAALVQLRDRLQPNCPANVQLKELSMGMSGDFPIAVEEGATIVRVGSALFE